MWSVKFLIAHQSHAILVFLVRRLTSFQIQHPILGNITSLMIGIDLMSEAPDQWNQQRSTSVKAMFFQHPKPAPRKAFFCFTTTSYNRNQRAREETSQPFAGKRKKKTISTRLWSKNIPISKRIPSHFLLPSATIPAQTRVMSNLKLPFWHILQLLSLFSVVHIAFSEIRSTRIIDDARPMILFERFGFSNDGHVSVSLKSVSWRPRQSTIEMNPSSMGFILLREASYAKILNESEYSDRFCVVSSHYVKLIFTFRDLTVDSAYNGSIAVDDPDEYSLVFGNCQPEFEVTMDVKTEMYNLENDQKDFLPAGQTQLPKLFFAFFLIYAAFCVSWIYTCIKQRATVDKIHIMMGALLFFKALKMICASEDQSFVKRTGTPHGWDIAFYILGFFKGVTLFTVIILIGTGWSFIKPYLQEREKNLLMFVIPLQVLENIASIVIGETGPSTKDWLTWNQIFLLIDIICCCAVFFPIIWSIRSLREASKTDGKAARNLAKLTLFKQFYVVVVGYLYFTRIVVSAIGAVVNYKFQWISTASMETASLAFYVFIFYNFQPIEKNPYFVIDDEEEEAAALALAEDDSFEL